MGDKTWGEEKYHEDTVPSVCFFRSVGGTLPARKFLTLIGATHVSSLRQRQTDS